MRYNVSNQAGQTTITIFGTDGYNKVIPNNHPCFVQVLTHLTTKQDHEHDEEFIKSQVDPTIGIGRILAEHFGERVTYDLHHLYLDGAKVDGSLARTIKARLFSQDQDWLRFVKFLVNLDSNPSYRAQQATWQWVEKNGLTITEDGRFLGYKAVNHDFRSSSAGPMNYIDGVLFEEGARTTVPHVVGSVISKKRADVDDTPGGGCSTGLHVGTETYARGFAPVLVTVAVNPADVVSAPDNDLQFKIRVCKYEVISLADDKQFSTGSYDVSTAPEHPVAVVDIENAEDNQFRVVARFETVEEAEQFLANHPNQEQVERGGFSIDAPEPEHVPDVKSDERLAREQEVAALSDDQRHLYNQVRKDGSSHEDALAAADQFEQSVFEEEADEEDSNPFTDSMDAVLEHGLEVIDNLTDEEIDAALSEPQEETMEAHEARVREDAAAGRWETEETAKPLSYYAEHYEALRKDLEDRSLGHKPLARKYEWLTTEASVRRYRKANNISLKVSAKVKDAVS